MKIIQKVKEYWAKISVLALLISVYVTNFVSAQIQPDRRSSSQIPAVGNLEQKTLQQLVADFIIVASGYVLKILLGLIVLTFMYGLMKYMFKGQGSDTARTEGRKLMLWGIIGLFVVTSLWGLVAIFTSFVGHESIVIPQFK